jgi:hypothetical protein
VREKVLGTEGWRLTALFLPIFSSPVFSSLPHHQSTASISNSAWRVSKVGSQVECEGIRFSDMIDRHSIIAAMD